MINVSRTITCIAVDDEPLALDLLEANIRDIPFLELKAKFTSAVNAHVYLNEHSVDLLFLDIQTPGMTGIELSRALSFPPMIIFTTAFDHYAIESYELSAVDYLLKPIDRARFVSACEKAKQRKLIISTNELNQQVIIPSEYEKILLFLKDIIYVQGMKDYVKIFTSNNLKPILTRMNLKGIEQLLNSELFMRVHKSYLVNTEYVSVISSRHIKLNEVKIPLGENYKYTLNQKFRLSGSSNNKNI